MSSEQGSPSVLPTLTGAETREHPLQGGDGELSFPMLVSPLFFPQLTVAVSALSATGYTFQVEKVSL